MSRDIPLILQQALLSGLVALALQFLAIGFRLREDRLFLQLGGILAGLCGLVALDLWIIFPAISSAGTDLAWAEAANLAYQAGCCVVGMVMLRLFRSLVGWPGPRFVRIQTLALILWMAVALIDLPYPGILFITVVPGGWKTSLLYDWVFFPYTILSFGWVFIRAFLLRRRASPESRRILRRLSLAFLVLLFAGGLDFVSVMSPGALPAMTSYTMIGMLGLNALCTAILTDRLIRQYLDRRASLLETARVHEEMGAREPLRQIGLSAAMVSDLIRDEVSALRGKVAAIGREGWGARSEVVRIENARRKLERLTGGILEYSRSAIPGSREPAVPQELARAALAEVPEAEGRARLEAGAGLGPVRGDGRRVARALAQLVRNALEAGAGTVTIRIRQRFGRTVFAVDDDGRGMSGGWPSDITRPFFTTRKAEGALGLGASIAEGVFRGHGGRLRYHAKPGRGMVAVAVLPDGAAAGLAPEPAPECLLISADPARIESFLAACESLGVKPLVAAEPPRPHTVSTRWTIHDRNLPAGGGLTEEDLLDSLEALAAAGLAGP